MPDEKLSNDFLSIASPLVDAAMDTLSLLVDREFKTEAGSVSDLSAEDLDKSTSEHQVAIRVPVAKEPLEAEICLLMKLADVTVIGDLLKGGEGMPGAELSDELQQALQTALDQMIAAAEAGLKNAVDEAFSLGSPAMVNLADDNDALNDLKGSETACAEFKIVCENALDSTLLAVAAADALGPFLEETARAGTEETSDELAPEATTEQQPGADAQPILETVDAENIDLIMDVQLAVVARLGRVQMPISEVLALGPGAIIEVGHSVEEPVELFVNEKLIARGEVVVVDEKFGLKITEIVSPSDRVKSLR